MIITVSGKGKPINKNNGMAKRPNPNPEELCIMLPRHKMPPILIISIISIGFSSASGGQGGRFLKKLPPLDPPAKTFD